MPPLADLDIYKLLHWESGLTTKLVGRDRQRQDLLDWAGESLPVERPRVRFLTGPGGAGKTRLAAEVARALTEIGWTAGFIALGQKFVLPARRNGLFLIVDYPEERRSETCLLYTSDAADE